MKLRSLPPLAVDAMTPCRGLAARAAAALAVLACSAAPGSAVAPFLGSTEGRGAGEGHGRRAPRSGGAGRVERIAAAMEPTFRAVPKDWRGRVAPAGARHLLRMYFATQRSWRVAGLEPHTWQGSGARAPGAGAARHWLPAAATDLFNDAGVQGFSLEDVATMAWTVEGFVTDESLDLLGWVLSLNGVASSAALAPPDAQRMLTEALLLFASPGVDFAAMEAARLRRLLARSVDEVIKSQKSVPSHWDTAGDAMRNFGFARRHSESPFRSDSLSTEGVSIIGPSVVEAQEEIRQRECTVMKEDLVARDEKRNGLLPLASFYARSERGFAYREKVEHLRAIGALDETSAQHPQVRIVNYILGPSNCGSHSSTMSLCCLNECERLMSEIEGQVQAPTATAEQLISFVGNLSSSSVDGPRRLSAGLSQRLHAIAAKRGGQVPLHGRLFAEWLHVAFPHECPFPHVVADAAVHTFDHWQSTQRVYPEPRRAAAQAQFANAAADGLPSRPADIDAWPWVEDEVLHMPLDLRGGCVASALHRAAQLALIAATCGALLRFVRAAPLVGGPSKARGAHSDAAARAGARGFDGREAAPGAWVL